MSESKQLIICLETTPKNKSDYFYVDSIIKQFYNIEDNKLTYVYLSGKHNYKSMTITNRIKKHKSAFSLFSKRTTIVIYVFDKDDFDINPNHKEFNQNVNLYCKDNKHEVVWFVKDIESVMLGRKVASNQKRSEALKYYKRDKIKNIDINKLKSRNTKSLNKSNILNILDKYLKRK